MSDRITAEQETEIRKRFYRAAELFKDAAHGRVPSDAAGHMADLFAWLATAGVGALLAELDAVRAEKAALRDAIAVFFDRTKDISEVTRVLGAALKEKADAG